MDNNLRTLYDTFLDSGELIEVFPEAVGIWEKDKDKFEVIYSNLDTSLLQPSLFKDEDEEVEDIYWEDDFIGY